MYVLDGRKTWHTALGSFELFKGDCVFVRKGASIVEQFWETEFCFFLFSVPDEFIRDVLETRCTPLTKSLSSYKPVMPIHNSKSVEAFFQSMMPYFDAARRPDPSLIELKFRELILLVADNPSNTELLACFNALMQEPQKVTLQRVMEENFCFNLKTEEFARLCQRSLSSFKRDFQRIYNSSPGKWLLEKRLLHAMNLLANLGKTVTETAFESGFESPSHFSRAFRNYFGHSPLSVKQKMAI